MEILANSETSVLDSIASPERLQALYEQACAELDALQPQLEALDAELAERQARHQQLRQNKQRLLTLKLSLQPLLTSDNEKAFLQAPPVSAHGSDPVFASSPVLIKAGDTNAAFSSDVAFHEINQRLRQRDSVNYEIFRAIVYHGGVANTDDIRQYLVEQNVKQPGSGDSFEAVSLADISARVNYLVKKGLVSIERRGVFRSTFGWVENH